MTQSEQNMPGSKYYGISDVESEQIQYRKVEITVVAARGLEVGSVRRKYICQLKGTKFYLDRRNNLLRPNHVSYIMVV